MIWVHGGVKFYRGAAKAARAYVERDRSRADDYYLGEGTGVAARLAATPDGVENAGSMDGDTYEQWVAGVDVDTGRKKGRIRNDANALRFVEVTVNGPKTWSLAAALHPEIVGPRWTKPRTRLPPRSSAGSLNTRPPGSGHADGRCRYRLRRSRPR
ncbi:MAG: relaxase domain-containing protein [Nocardioidaceae bacterium]